MFCCTAQWQYLFCPGRALCWVWLLVHLSIVRYHLFLVAVALWYIRQRNIFPTTYYWRVSHEKLIAETEPRTFCLQDVPSFQNHSHSQLQQQTAGRKRCKQKDLLQEDISSHLPFTYKLHTGLIEINGFWKPLGTSPNLVQLRWQVFYQSQKLLSHIITLWRQAGYSRTVMLSKRSTQALWIISKW